MTGAGGVGYEGAESSLWAITSYFNPCGSRRRLANYRRFRRGVPVPLVTVELSFGAPFELAAGDAEVLIQLPDGDVMWQKERLLNVALRALPDACRQVAWLDCDVLIGGDDWPALVGAALERAPVAQAFSRVCYLRRDAADVDPHRPDATEFWQPGFVQSVAAGRPLLESLRRSQERVPGECALGFAWAARREWLAPHGLYDACIVGGGDVAFACAVFGCFEELARRQHFNRKQREYYLAWAAPFHAALNAEAAFVDCPLYHLWHGALADRRGRERHEGLRAFQFDPSEDLARTAEGAWRWNSPKPEMHQYVRDYFAARRDDG